MKKKTAMVIRVTTLLSLLLSFILAISIPLGYLAMVYRYEAAVIETEAEATAFQVSRLIGENPEYWRFEQPRIEGFLSFRPTDMRREIRRIVGPGNAVIAQYADQLEPPFITRFHDLHDSGSVVARVEITRSLRPFLVKALLLGLLGFGVGIGLFVFLRMFPLRALARTMQSLRDSEARFSAIALTAADAIIVMDDRGSISYWNRAAEKIFGYTAQETLGRELHTLIAPSMFHEHYQRGFERFLSTGSGPAIGGTLEFAAVRKDGTQFPIEVSTSALELNGVWHAVGIIRDISGRKKAEEEQLKLEKLESLGLFAGGIAHDFNNLLTVVLGNISLVQLDTDPAGAAYRWLTDAERSIVRARDLTQQLLTFARGGLPVKKTASIQEVIEDACALALSGSRLKAELAFAAGLHPVDVDEGQIAQVIHNLVINAVQAMPHGGVIRVTGENVVIGPGEALPLAAGPYVRISIRDQGVGIPREHLSKIFDPYFTTKQKGSGLGLATCYSIVKKHDGSISVESELGAGSVFYIHLPASVHEMPARKIRAQALVTGKGKVLVMDDETEVRAVAGAMLTALGYEPAFAQDGAEAVACYQSAFHSRIPFQAVILDLTIPGGMGGKDAIRELLAFDPHARVIVASGYSNDPVMAEFKAHGFSGVIAKPFTVEMLGTVMRSVMA